MRSGRLRSLCIVAGVSAAVTWVSCIEDRLVECGDVLCPSGGVCTAAGCATANEVAACADLADGERCTPEDADARACRAGACRTVECGDSLTELDERCDDGNVVSGDMCAADCRSTELCGNGLLDNAVGEQCDSGTPGLSGDGCSSRCMLEFRIWRSLVFPAPTSRVRTGVVRDAKDRLLRIGGGLGSGGGTVVADVLAFDGLTWRLLESATTLPPLSKVAVTYDTHRKMVVLFGGEDLNHVPTAETWEWDSVDWIRRSPPLSPGARAGARLAYDPLRRRSVLYGGSSDAETWEWDGSTGTWALVAALGPGSRMNHALAFAPGLDKVVLSGQGGGSGETSAWDGTTWAPLPTSTPVALRYSLAHDEQANELLLLTDSQTLRLQLNQWQVAGGAPTTITDPMAVNPRTRLTVMTYNDPHEWTGTAWQARVPMQQPGLSDRAAFDSHRGRSVVVSPYTTSTWEWDGSGWEQRSVATLPSSSGLAYDAARRVTLQFGGTYAGPAVAETWTWDGAGWAQRFPALSPAARNRPQLAFDEARGVVVLFGGATSTELFADTWEWDGSMWTPRTPAQTPGARREPAMAYDAKRQRVVLFGGTVGSVLGNDTWQWDGTTWTQLATVATPPARAGGTLLFDPRRGRIVLFGGTLDNVATQASDLWELVVTETGSTWELRSPFVTLAERVSTAFVDVNGAVNLIAGQTGAHYRLRSESMTPAEDCRAANRDSDGDSLAGCADPDCSGRCAGCGDGVCNTWIEDHHLCPADCTWP